MNHVVVSIICNAYNHGPYIAKCLDGFIMQETNFPFEVLVHDDASTDNTASIIREYENKYPELIKPIYQTENQYSKGGISQFQYPRVSGKYVAICEGDDYWTDPKKLQKQYEAMEQHPEIDICAHSAQCIECATGKLHRNVAPRKTDCIISTEDVIAGGGGFVATNTLFYRSTLITDIPKFRADFTLDYTLQVHGALRGGMLYLADYMAVYRYMVPGSWTDRFKKNRTNQEKNFQRMQNMLADLNAYTNFQYNQTIQYRILRNEWNYMNRWDNYRILLQPRFKQFRNELSWKKKLKFYAKAAFPWTYKLKRKLKAK